MSAATGFFSQQMIDEALTRPCGLGHCRQPAGTPCIDLRGNPIPSVVHLYRAGGDRW